MDTWLLVLGIKGLEERVVGSIQETLGFNGPDRLTMVLAFTRVVQTLLSSVGHLLLRNRLVRQSAVRKWR